MIFLPITHSRFGINSPIFPALKTAQNKDHIFSLSHPTSAVTGQVVRLSRYCFFIYKESSFCFLRPRTILLCDSFASVNRTNRSFHPIFVKNLARSPMGRNLKMTKPQGEGWLTPAKPENATSVQLTSFGGFVFLFTDVILTVQSATRFFRASSEADCVTFVAGLTPTKDDDAASVDFGR